MTMFAMVRFYLGYPAIGLLKFSTLGFFFIGHLVRIHHLFISDDDDDNDRLTSS